MSEEADEPSEREIDDAYAAAVDTLRGLVRLESALAAEKLRQVAVLAAVAEAAGRAELAVGPRVPGQPADAEVLETAVLGVTAATLGVSEHQASRTLLMARRLTRALPDTLAAFAQGRIDQARAWTIVEATAESDLAVAQQVEAQLLPAAGDGPWDGPSPRAWRLRAARAVATIDPESVSDRRRRAVREREVRAWPEPDGMGVLRVRAAAEEIALADQTVQQLAQRWAATDQHGRRLTIDQRRTDALLDLLRRAREGGALAACPHDSAGRAAAGHAGTPTNSGAPDATGQPGATTPAGTTGTRGRRGRLDVSVVLHADTLFRDGPAQRDPGMLRGLGTPSPLDGHTARRIVRRELDRGASLRVLLTTSGGQLIRVLHLPAGSTATRHTLTEAVQKAMGRLRPLHTTTYTPTATITEHVHARNPHCTAYDCPRVATNAELDHDTPWPRGPTDADNLQPRCPRHHQIKTRRLVTTTLAPDGAVTTRLLTGTTITTRPEPLPGHGPGEGYGARRN